MWYGIDYVPDLRYVGLQWYTGYAYEGFLCASLILTTVVPGKCMGARTSV